jgi:hypothetical protein
VALHPAQGKAARICRPCGDNRMNEELLNEAVNQAYYKISGDILKMLQGYARLLSIAQRAGAWQTTDGVWVFGDDPVYHYAFRFEWTARADAIEPAMRKHWLGRRQTRS